MSATAACADLAPQGILRASINLGNPLLARRDGSSGEVFGVSVDLARALAERLGVPLELEVFDTAGRSVEAVSEARADVGFFAIDPQRGQDIAFTAPYVLIEGCYLVREASPLTCNEEVDRAGHRIVVGQGSAYDLYLSRAMGLPRARGEAAAARLHEFVESMKASGFVAEALARHQVAGVTLAPPAGERPVSTE